MKEFKIKKISGKLKKSPIFNLSLGSKELFHSNFIDWLAKNYPQESAKIFARFIKNQSGDISIVKTYRELDHTDVHFFFTNINNIPEGTRA